MDYRGLVVADDLTGAADAGHRLAARGHEVAITTTDRRPDADVLVRDTDSRHLPPEEAATRVRKPIETTDAGVVYQKIDSTLRGNVVAGIDTGLRATEAELALVAPAFPANGRITVGGFHLVDGTPVAETEIASDPDAPVETSSLLDLLSDSRHPVEHLPVEVATRGPGSVRERLESIQDSDRQVIVACDAARDDHLESIALGASAVDADILYVGSAGLAGHVRFDETQDVLGIAGSTARETLAGLDALPGRQVVELDGPMAIEDPADAIDRTSKQAAEALDAEGRVVVTAARSKDAVEETVASGDEAGLSESETRDRIASSLGRVARTVTERNGIDGLFLTGGATAESTLSALDADGIRLTGNAVESGVPIGRIEGGLTSGVPVVTKAGAFGDRETTLSCLDALAAYDG